MIRDFSRLDDGPFDVLIIGGGIYGAWTAYDAAIRGLKVALIEARDWASGTSSSSSKLIHGGLRYLEYMHFGLVRKALRERRRLSNIAPHRVYPLRLVTPIYESSRVGMGKMDLGLWVYDILAGFDQPVDRHRRLNKNAVLERCPYLETNGLKGGFGYGDCGTDDARLVVEIVSGAEAQECAAVNYARMVDLLRDDERVIGATVEDVETGQQIEVRASTTVATCGPWLKKMNVGPDLRLTKGVHLVMPQLPGEDGLLLTARSDGRVFFLLPWYGRTLLGTTDTDYNTDPGEVKVEPEDIDYLLSETKVSTPGLEWDESDICGSYAGVRVLKDEPGKSPSEVTREWHLHDAGQGLIVPVGGKLTSARVEAATTVDRIIKNLGKPTTICLTGDRDFPWLPEEIYDWEDWVKEEGPKRGMDEETVDMCMHRLGIGIEMIYTMIEEDPDLAKRIHPDFPFCRAEIVHAVRNEMARTLEDVLRRRIPLSILVRLDQSMMEDAAKLVGAELNWSDERRSEELRTLRDRQRLTT